MLEQDWRQLVVQGKASDSTPTASFSLKEFEDEIGLIRRFGTSVSASNIGGSIVAGDIHQRLKTRTRQELANLESLGWGIHQLLLDVEIDVVATAQKINAFRPHVAAYSQLVRRLTPLPWHRDVELALEVQEQLRDPTQLASLAEKIPLLTQHLSTQKSDTDSFVFEAWMPAPTRQTLVPVPETFTRQTMVPTDAIGDAHEAILEAMEPEKEIPEPVVEEAEEEVNDAPPPPPVEVEVPEETTAQQDVAPPASIEPQEKTTLDASSSPVIFTNIIQFLGAINLDELADDLALNGADSLPNVRRQLAKHVGITPRDTRVDRILRLALRLLPQNKEGDVLKSELLARIGGNTKAMKRWMRARLENRHSGSSDVFLEDALKLGKALQRIPGPGHPLSLEIDEYELPNSDDVVQLEYEVEQLLAHMNLPSAGGILA
jgi:hypothetical protein